MPCTAVQLPEPAHTPLSYTQRIWRLSGRAATNTMPGLRRSLATIAAVYAFSMTWAVLQERIASVPYGGEPLPSVLVLNLAQSLAACVVSSTFVARFSAREAEKLPPLSAFLLTATLHTAASPVMYSALAFIAYPHVQLVSAVKLVPMALVGWAVSGRRITGRVALCVTLMTVGVVIFSAEKAAKSEGGAFVTGVSTVGGAEGGDWSLRAFSASLSAPMRVTVGVLLVLLNLCFDAGVGAAQDAVHAASKRSGRGALPPLYMMAAQNGWAAVLLAGYLVVQWALVGSAAALPSSLAFFGRHADAAGHLLAFAACGSAAQLAIFASLASHGAFSTTSITLSRKFFSLLLSTLIYGHVLSAPQWVAIALIFSGLAVQLGGGRDKGMDGGASPSGAVGPRRKRRGSDDEAAPFGVAVHGEVAYGGLREGGQFYAVATPSPTPRSTPPLRYRP